MNRPHWSWVFKAIAQKFVSQAGLLPAYHRLQQRGGRLRAFHPMTRSEYPAKLVSDIAPKSIEGARILEIGTGWVPVAPLLLHLMGAGPIVTIDLNRHLQPDLTLRIVPLLRECFGDIDRRINSNRDPEKGLPDNSDLIPSMEKRLQRLEQAKTINELLSLANIEYRAPGDASDTGLPDGSIDVIYSNLVLEHITTNALAQIHNESHRLLASDGVIWHNVDYSDHYAATIDISPINMLRYSNRFWAWLGNNDILYQNRLRRSQHVALFKEAGLKIRSYVDHDVSSEALRGVKPNTEFAGISSDELRVLATRFVLEVRENAA